MNKIQIPWEDRPVGCTDVMWRYSQNPGKNELLAVGLQAGLEKSWCEEVIEKMKNTVEERLEKYL